MLCFVDSNFPVVVHRVRFGDWGVFRPIWLSYEVVSFKSFVISGKDDILDFHVPHICVCFLISSELGKRMAQIGPPWILASPASSLLAAVGIIKDYM